METVYAVKAGGDWTLDVLGVPFGGPFNGKDGAGDYLDAKSNIHADKFPMVPAVYAHGFDPNNGKRVEPQFIGLAKYDHVDERGHWYKVVLNKTSEFAKKIWESALKGIAGASSGAISHLVRRSLDGHLDHWPVVEMTLVDGSGILQPVNPYAVAFPEMKAMFKEAEIEINESDVAGDAARAGDAQAQSLKLTQNDKGGTMTVEDQKAADEKAVAEKAISDAKAAEATKAGPIELSTIEEFTKEFQAQQKAKSEQAAMKATAKQKMFDLLESFSALKTDPANNIGSPAIKKVSSRGFKNDENEAFARYILKGDEVAYKAAMQGQTDGEGGYAVPDDFYNQVIAKRNELSVARRMGVIVMPTSLDRILVPAEGTAATKFVVEAEEANYDENEPTLGQVIIAVHKLTKLIKISEELEVDAKANFTGWLSGVWGRALALAENYYFVGTGTGTGMPKAMLVGATSSSITTAAATAVTAAEILQLIYTMPSAYADSMALVMQRSTLGKIRALTGNPFSFISTPAGNGTATADGDIHGIPVFTTDAMPASTAGLLSVLLINPSFYGIAEREGLTVSRNPYLYQLSGQIGLFAKSRVGGNILQAEAAYYITQHA